MTFNNYVNYTEDVAEEIAQSTYASQSIAFMLHNTIEEPCLRHFYSRHIWHELDTGGFNHLNEELTAV